MVPAIVRQRPRTHDPTPRSSSRPAVGIARDRVARSAAPLRSILVPLDFTPQSDRVLARVAQLSLAYDTRVTLLHVIPGHLALRATQKAMQEAGTSLAREAWHLRRHVRPKVRIESRVRVGTAAVQIAGEAAAIDADLIVMGRGGGHPLRDAVLGSTAERVIRRAARPVLAVRQSVRGPYHHPAFALALDAVAPRAVSVGLQVVSRPAPWVDVIHAFEIPFQGPVYPGLPRDEARALRQSSELSTRQALQTVLDAATADAGIESADRPKWIWHLRMAAPRKLVEEVTAFADSDLLVVGTRARSGAAFVVLGSVAGELLRAARCDVLVVPPGPTTRPA